VPGMIDAATFEARLRSEGYDEIVQRSREETPANEVHDHPFDATILVLAGSFGLTVEGGEAVFHGPGEQFTVPAGVRHQETFPAGGASWLAGIRNRA